MIYCVYLVYFTDRVNIVLAYAFIFCIFYLGMAPLLCIIFDLMTSTIIISPWQSLSALDLLGVMTANSF